MLKRRILPLLSLLLLTTACALQPPISIGQRESLVGQGAVLSVTNTSEDYLHEVVVTITSPKGEVKEFGVPTLDPHETLNVGWLKLEGWPIPDGSKVTVACKGFPLSVGPYTVGK